MLRPPPSSTLFPYTTLFRSHRHGDPVLDAPARIDRLELRDDARTARLRKPVQADHRRVADQLQHRRWSADRKSTRLNSSHRCISYAVFCLKKKKKINMIRKE